MLLAAAATESSEVARYTVGMVVIGVLVLVLWIGFRRMFDEPAPGPEKKKAPPKAP